MNREEAVCRQDVLDLAKKGILISNGSYKSVCKAINELPPVNPQPCEDAIDRAEAIKIASGYCHPANVAKELAKLPPVNPTKTGHWIPIQEIIGVDKEGNEISATVGYKCSKCLIVHPHTSIFCPSCGCRMVEPQERSDKE